MKPTSHSNKMHGTQHADLELWVSLSLRYLGQGETGRQSGKDRETGTGRHIRAWSTGLAWLWELDRQDRLREGCGEWGEDRSGSLRKNWPLSYVSLHPQP